MSTQTGKEKKLESSEEKPNLSILLLVFSGETFSREFPSLPHRDEGSLQPRGDDRAEQKSSGVQADDSIYFSTVEVGYRVRGQTI